MGGMATRAHAFDHLTACRRMHHAGYKRELHHPSSLSSEVQLERVAILLSFQRLEKSGDTSTTHLLAAPAASEQTDLTFRKSPSGDRTDCVPAKSYQVPGNLLHYNSHRDGFT